MLRVINEVINANLVLDKICFVILSWNDSVSLLYFGRYNYVIALMFDTLQHFGALENLFAAELGRRA